jgi:hypothetical protein
MLRVRLVKIRSDRQPEIDEDNHTAKHVEAVETGDGKVGSEERVVLRHEHVRTIDILLRDMSDLVALSAGARKCGRSFAGSDGLAFTGIELHVILLPLRIAKRLGILRWTGDLVARLQPLSARWSLPRYCSYFSMLSWRM